MWLLALVACGAAGTVAALVLVEATAEAAEGAEISGGSSREQATAIEPGRYLDTLAPGAARWYSIELAAGQALALGGALFPPESLDQESVEGSLAFSVRSPSGEQWVGSREVSTLFIGEGNAPETLGALTPPAGGSDPPVSESAAAFTEVGIYSFGFSLKGEGGKLGELAGVAGLQLELAVDRLDSAGGEPGGALLPSEVFAAPPPATAEQGGASDRPSDGSARDGSREGGPRGGEVLSAPVAGGDSFNDAPLLEPGRYAGMIETGEDAYYAVAVPAGQRAQVGVGINLAEGPRRRLERGLNSYLLAAYTPIFQPTGEDGELAEGRSVLVRTRTARATPAGDLVDEVGAGELEGPGVWYFRLFASEPFTGEGREVEVPTEIEVQLKGEALEAPDPTPVAGDEPPADGNGGVDESVEGPGGFGAATIALVVVAALLVAAGVGLAVRRRSARG